jgi:hypothetical protein
MKRPLRSLTVLALLAFAPLLPAQEAEKAPQKKRLQDDPPVWAGSFEEATGRAKKIHGGRVLVELREAACPDCERMEKLVYPTASFRAFCRDKVPVSLIVGTEDGNRIAARYAVRAFPAWIIVSTDGLLCGKQEGASNQSAWVERFVATEREWNAFLAKLEAEKKAPNDLAAVCAVAEDAYRRFGDAMAEKRFRRIADDPKASPELKEKSLPYLASIELASERFDDAERDLKALLALTKDPLLRQKAELRLVDVSVGRGDRRKAEEQLKAFLGKYPDSPLKPQAEALLQALRPAKP